MRSLTGTIQSRLIHTQVLFVVDPVIGGGIGGQHKKDIGGGGSLPHPPS